MNNTLNKESILKLDILEKKQLFNNLFDFYEPLLTEKQQTYFKAYSFEDMSLSEIAQNFNVSRNAIFDQISNIYTILYDYEEKLGLYQKFCAREKLYQQFSDIKDDNLISLIEKLKEIE